MHNHITSLPSLVWSFIHTTAGEHWCGADAPADAQGLQRHSCLYRWRWSTRALLRARGPPTPAFRLLSQACCRPGLCSGCFHHQEGSSSMDCSLISFKSSFKIIFSDACPEDPGSFSEVRALNRLPFFSGHPQPVAWYLPDWTQVISHVITADSALEATQKC